MQSGEEIDIRASWKDFCCQTSEDRLLRQLLLNLSEEKKCVLTFFLKKNTYTNAVFVDRK